MKRYQKLTTVNLTHLIEISKTKTWNGDVVTFFHNGRKRFQSKYKNNKQNGFTKIWETDARGFFFANLKRGNAQGIRIKSER